ncbi:hypothetical protein [Streptomyces wuyuanensis]|uniref:hypothetical protein n=1 Tax=Streptomyces wuyuanensis TaxID=1196353 RepID=UPI003441C648
MNAYDDSARSDGMENDVTREYDPEAPLYIFPDDRTTSGWRLVTREEIEAAHEEALEMEREYAEALQDFQERLKRYREDFASSTPSEGDIQLAAALRRAGYLPPDVITRPHLPPSHNEGREMELWPPPLFEIEAASAEYSRDRMGDDGSDEDEPAKLGVGQFADDPSRYLFYRGRDNSVFGPWDSGKTWLVIAVAAEFVRQGKHVVFLNFEQNTVADLKGRMMKVGVTKAWVDAFFHVYDHPNSAPEVDEPVELVILDALNPAINHVGKNTNDAAGPNLVYGTYLRPLRDENPQMTSVILDHPNKDNDKTEGGTGRKGEITQAVKYRMASTERSRVGTRGYSTLLLAKDNTGELDADPGDAVAYVVRDSSQDRDAITVQILSHEPSKKGESAAEGRERQSNHKIALGIIRRGPLTDDEWQEAVVVALREKFPKHTDAQLGKNARQARYVLRRDGVVEQDESGLWVLATE